MGARDPKDWGLPMRVRGRGAMIRRAADRPDGGVQSGPTSTKRSPLMWLVFLCDVQLAPHQPALSTKYLGRSECVDSNAK
jgi:hypothetical protein